MKVTPGLEMHDTGSDPENEGFKSLQEGAEVEFELGQGDKGPQALDVTLV